LQGGSFNAIRPWLVDSPLQVFINAIGIFGSPKGLFIFAPVLLLCIYAIPNAFRTHRDTTVFALLVTGGTLAFLSILIFTSDEVWGTRYMHIAIAPLVVCIGIAARRFQWRRHIPLLGLALTGVVISFLGSFFYYGSRLTPIGMAGQNTMEWITGDIRWNEVVFGAKVFRVWLKGGTAPVPWTPTHIWVWSPPDNAQGWTTINLRDYSLPQSVLLREWGNPNPKDGTVRVICRLYFFSLVAGTLLLLWVVFRTATEQRLIAAPTTPVSRHEISVKSV
jgi:hypothetical protein